MTKNINLLKELAKRMIEERMDCSFSYYGLDGEQMDYDENGEQLWNITAYFTKEPYVITENKDHTELQLEYPDGSQYTSKNIEKIIHELRELFPEDFYDYDGKETSQEKGRILKSMELAEKLCTKGIMFDWESMDNVFQIIDSTSYIKVQQTMGNYEIDYYQGYIKTPDSDSIIRYLFKCFGWSE